MGNNNAEVYYSSSKIGAGKNTGNAIIVRVNGKKFDATDVIGAIGGGDSKTKSSLTLDAKVGEVFMSNGRKFKDFEASAKCGFERCFSISATSRFASSGKFNLTLGNEKQNDFNSRRVFNLETDNAGAFIKALGINDNVEGGYALISSITQKDDQNQSEGTIFVKDYKIVGAPILARIFSLASFSGITELLTGNGVPMNKLTGKFRTNRNFIAFEDIVSSGNSLGITTEGNYNRNTGRVDLSGSVSPSYSVNSALGKIPVLGRIFSATKGAGLIAAQYSVKGISPDVKVSVNPLSALTPGFLGNIWGSSSTDIDKKEKNEYPSNRN